MDIEKEAREKRPADILKSASREAQRCFAGIFNGARREGHLWGDDALFIGKAECEWGWRDTWSELKALGLVDYRLEEVSAPGAVSGKMTKFYCEVTEKGWDVREDDLAEWNERRSLPAGVDK
jgi:hypothetical protein